MQTHGTSLSASGMSGGEAVSGEVTEGNVGVPIMGTAAKTMAALCQAIAGQDIDIDVAASGDSCTLTNRHKCAASNAVIVRLGTNISVSGMSGGADGGTGVTPGNTGVAVGWSLVDCAENLYTALLAAGV